jgi:hypothetical protein
MATIDPAPARASCTYSIVSSHYLSAVSSVEYYEKRKSKGIPAASVRTKSHQKAIVYDCAAQSGHRYILTAFGLQRAYDSRNEPSLPRCEVRWVYRLCVER